jgi:hypothetical protein
MLELCWIHNRIFLGVYDSRYVMLLLSCYFTLPSETHDPNVVSGSVQVCFVPAVLSTSESVARSALCHTRTAAVRIFLV